MPSSNQKSQFIEEVGLFFEQLQMPRTSGRMMGWLLICEPSHQSMQNLCKNLQVTKGSISTAARVLMHYLILEKVKFPKDRQDYYRIKPGAWTSHFQGQSQMMGNLKNLAMKGLSIMKGRPKKEKERLMEMASFYEWLEQEMPKLVKRWQKDQAQLKKRKN